MLAPFTFLIILPCIFSKVYFHESGDADFTQRWVYSADSSVTHGVFESVPIKFAESESELGLQTKNDSSYYHMSAKLSDTLDLSSSDLYFQYVATYRQDVDCAGGYLKLFADIDQKALNGETPYHIMFGPDMCGYTTRKLHVIIHHNGKNHLIKNEISLTLDRKPHFYQLVVKKDKTFSVYLDSKLQVNGSFEEHFDILEPKTIPDPTDIKPEDWVEEAMILDPSETYDERETITDPDATKPEGWNDEEDGEWVPDTIKNPAFFEHSERKKIKNPLYKGPWSPRQIDNPEYKEDSTVAHYKIQTVGFDLWQVRSGTVFDEIFISDDAAEAKQHEETVMAKLEEQVKLHDKEEAEVRQKMMEERDKEEKEKKEKGKSDDDEDDEGSDADDDEDDDLDDKHVSKDEDKKSSEDL